MDTRIIEEIAAKIDELALKAVMLEATDVGGMGDLLNQTESLLGYESPGNVIVIISRSLCSLVETIIMNQDQDLSRHMGMMAKGVSLLQEGLRCMKLGDSLPAGSIESYWEELRELGVEVESGKPQVTDSSPEKTQTDEVQKVAVEEAEVQEPQERPPSEAEKPQEQNLIVDSDTCYEFITETLSNLEEVEPLVVELESDPTNKEIIGAIFRCFHTAKGVSGFLNLRRMNRYTHESENLLDEVRNDRIHFDQRIGDFLFEGFDFLREMLEGIRANLDKSIPYEPDYDVDPGIQRIHALLSDTYQPEVPAPDEDVREPIGRILVDMKRVTPEDIDSALEMQKETPSKKIGEILSAEGKVTGKDVDEALNRQKSAEPTIRVATEKLDHIVDMVGELVIAQALVAENPVIQQTSDQKLVKDFSQLNRITSELQKTAMSMRMVPIRQTFQKMVRLVRDLSRKSGKLVDLTMAGEDTEIDRNLVDQVYDPLVHMVRNAMDHGLESPDERVSAGKSPSGALQLRAYHQGGHLFIEIAEDGRGLDRDKILKKAIDRGLVKPGGDYSDNEVFNFIFLPGFSTAERITDISGRGVGMDVVKKFVEKVRGIVEIKSTPGRGSTFIIKLPLTLAIIDGIVVMVGGERYIIPAQSVKESLQARKDQYITVSGKGEAINIRGKIFSLIRLHRIFDIKTEKTSLEDAILAVVEYENREACLMVDDVVGKQEVVIKSLGHRLSKVKGFSGGTILGDGRVGLILDIKGVMDIHEND
ncbi:MAG: chemotaxis protein CheA [Deltaproteobacteria bacterium]|nr:chemotaxis protein CheA [Deltaproteobacteria bacterium]